MNRKLFISRLSAAALLAGLWMSPLAAIAQQKPIVAPKNKYKVEDDVKLGNDAARQIEHQFPIINDREAAAYVERVGQRLVAAIPPQFDQPAFNYRFKWVNASDINAFALPGGPMFVNRGMLEAARNEGEMAGVMAHEISHVALRHATAEATKQSSAKNTLGQLGLILGGAILGGQAGAELGAIGAAAWMTKYSREYESQADALGARIMAAAGYDPHDLANMFRTIQQQSGGGGGPAWLSSHPDPGNRFEAINREAQYLKISPNPIKVTTGFARTKERFRALPRARTMAEIERGAASGGNYPNQYPNGNPNQYPNGNPNQDPASAGRYTATVQSPSNRLRVYTGIDWLRLNIPANWTDIPGQNSVEFAPEGAYGEQGITHGIMIGLYQGQNNDLESDADAYVNEVLQGNSYLRRRGSLVETRIAGRQGYAATASGRSPVTGKTENVTIFTTALRNGSLFYAVAVVPADESSMYSNTFASILNSVQLNDR